MKLTTIFFSATGNTQKYVAEMATASGLDVESIDVTARESTPRTFGSDDLVIFGAPVHAGLIPQVAAQRFQNFKGSQTPAIIVASYGNRHYDDALVQMSDILTESGFVPQGAAAMIGRHTFGAIQTDRPNASDLEEARSFMRRVLMNLDPNKNLALPGHRPYAAKGGKGSFRPKTREELCVGCGMCERDCPVGAIGKDYKTISEDCISCFRCIRNCPMHGKYIESEMYENFCKMLNEKLAEPRKNEMYY